MSKMAPEPNGRNMRVEDFETRSVLAAINDALRARIRATHEETARLEEEAARLEEEAARLEEEVACLKDENTRLQKEYAAKGRVLKRLQAEAYRLAKKRA